MIDRIRNELRIYLLHKGLSDKKSFRCLNPFHEDKNPSMRYNPKKKNVHCFSCGATYDIFDIIGLDYNLDSFYAQYEVACKIFEFGDIMESVVDSKSGIETDIIDKTLEFNQLYDSRDTLSDYLEKRGVSKRNIEKYFLFQKDGRIYLPIFDGSVCTGWVARIIDSNKGSRYLNSKGSLGIWNIDYVKQNGNGKKLFITEGIIDALSIEEHGGHAIALCGSGNSAKLIKYYVHHIETVSGWQMIICGDPDPSGEQMVKSLSKEFDRLEIDYGIMRLSPEDGDINELHVSAPEKLAGYISSSCVLDRSRIVSGESGMDFSVISHGENNEKSTKFSSKDYVPIADSLDDFFKECEKQGNLGGISTGFESLDKILDGGLYPGLYVLGAVTSVGKTSFALQMADYISQNGQDIIYISLEQSGYELIAKSISRLTAVLDDDKSKKNSFSVRDVLTYMGKENAQRMSIMSKAKELYHSSSSRMFVREGIGDISARNVRDFVKTHISSRGKKPVVVLDYLQIMSPMGKQLTDKQNIDRSIVELKRISRDFDTPVVVISSFNRENYRNAVSVEAFKESGAVEYSADVLMGIQFKGTGTKDFDIKTAKLKVPRDIELVLLKNRSGISHGKIEFKYDPRFSLIWENKKKEHVRSEKSKIFTMDSEMFPLF